MSNKNSKLAIGVAVLFEMMLIYMAVLNIISRQWKELAQVCLAIVCITLPFLLTFLANKKKVVLPSSFQSITVVFIILSLYFGELKKFYQMFWWWDLFLHGIFGIYAAIVGIYLALGVFIKKNDIYKKHFAILISIFAFCFSVALGTLWEIFEFLGDFFFKTTMVGGSLEDTMTDLIIKTIGAVVASAICIYRKVRD